MESMKQKKIQQPLEIDIKEMKEQECREFQIGDKKGLVCLEKGKLKFYELVPTNEK